MFIVHTFFLQICITTYYLIQLNVLVYLQQPVHALPDRGFRLRTTSQIHEDEPKKWLQPCRNTWL